jgi:bifunctional N-acetylglucosamine-1-phosphate-uridyltransferase/glucosamine-1-phosphate-acetyltransferase GlmU-like protein
LLFLALPVLFLVVVVVALLEVILFNVVSGPKATAILFVSSSMFLFVNQNKPQGTGDAIKQSLDYYDDDSDILILNGDMPLIKSTLLNTFVNSNISELKIMVSKIDNPHGYGRILFDNDNLIGIKEEKDCSLEEKQIDIINVGIYYFSSIILKKYIPMIDNNNAQQEYYLTDIIKLIKNNSNINIKTYLIDDNYKYQILGVNTQQELEYLENLFKS